MNLLDTLQRRFETHPRRHPGVTWAPVRARLDADPDAVNVLREMEASGGEPDVVSLDAEAPGFAGFVFCDCSAETPAGRRSLCFDEAALHARRENKPVGSALGMAASMGIRVLSEAQYRGLQALGEFDLKTSSWVMTPPEVRALGGALFCDRRYGQVFTYHNGAQSYYGVRGFRGFFKV